MPKSIGRDAGNVAEPAVPQSIGLDIGHSAVKVAIENDTLIFPTAAMAAVELGVEGAADSAKTDTVLVNSSYYFVGDTALIHSGGRVLDGLSDNWVNQEEHHALLVAGYQKAVRQLGTDNVTVSLGLPGRLYDSQKEHVRLTASSLLGLPKSKINVLPQPLAAFYSKLLLSDGEMNEAMDEDEKWYIIDIGHYTTDFGCFDTGVWSSANQESMDGMHVVAQNLKKLVAGRYSMDITMRDAERILRTKTLRYQGEVHDMSDLVTQASAPVARSVIDRAIQVFGGANVLGAHGVFVAGGGSALMFNHIKDVWKHAVCAENSRFAISEGLRRYGTAKALAAA